jgi:4-amino-4-deoxy-L-arabinose transferase-like glycosyltransferase
MPRRADTPPIGPGRALLVVLTLALVVRLAGLAATSGLGARIVDEQHYLVLATNLADGRGFSGPSGPTSLRPPLYPAFIAAIWELTGTRSLQIVRVAQVGLALLTAMAAYALARDLWGARAGVWAAAITSFYPSLLISNYLLLTEVLFALLVTAATWAAVRLFHTGSAWAAAGAGASIALAALTRSVLYPFAPLLAVLLLAWGPAPIRTRAGLAIVLLVAWAAVLAPWAVRNTRLQRVPVLVDTMGGMNLRMGNYEFTPLDRMWDAVSMAGDQSWIVGLPPPPPGQGPWTEGQKERWARGQAVAYMLAHPLITIERALVKCGDFWALERDFIAGVQRGLYAPPPVATAAIAAAVTVSYPIVLVLALFGLARLTRADWPAGWIPALVVLFVCALHSIVFGHPRYRLPLTPLMAVYAAPVLATASWRAPLGALARPRWAYATAGGFVLLWIVQFAWRDWSFAERLLQRWAA